MKIIKKIFHQLSNLFCQDGQLSLGKTMLVLTFIVIYATSICSIFVSNLQVPGALVSIFLGSVGYVLIGTKYNETFKSAITHKTAKVDDPDGRQNASK